jgi:(R,R)-butanediol dehydrogenase/meso-butanediol dehydrogenase/diacetyl reductase
LYERADFTTAVELLTEGAIPADTLITRIEPFGKAAEAFVALETGGDVMKVLIDCQREA